MFKFLRKLFKKDNGWVSSPGYTITVPKGKWTIGQKITIKANGKMKASQPTISADKDNELKGKE